MIMRPDTRVMFLKHCSISPLIWTQKRDLQRNVRQTATTWPNLTKWLVFYTLEIQLKRNEIVNPEHERTLCSMHIKKGPPMVLPPSCGCGCIVVRVWVGATSNVEHAIWSYAACWILHLCLWCIDGQAEWLLRGRSAEPDNLKSSQAWTSPWSLLPLEVGGKKIQKKKRATDLQAQHYEKRRF